MKGILFSAPMVRAIIAEAKTVTRRVMQPQPDAGEPLSSCRAYLTQRFGKGGELKPGMGRFGCYSDDRGWRAPFAPGEIVFVREAWATLATRDHLPARLAVRGPRTRVYYAASANPKPRWAGRARPGMFLPERGARLFLKIEAVFTEYLQQINEISARAEGIVENERSLVMHGRMNGCGVEGTAPEEVSPTYVGAFKYLWDSLHGRNRHGGKLSWEANPRVWVIGFSIHSLFRSQRLGG